MCVRETEYFFRECVCVFEREREIDIRRAFKRFQTGSSLLRLNQRPVLQCASNRWSSRALRVCRIEFRLTILTNKELVCVCLRARAACARGMLHVQVQWYLPSNPLHLMTPASQKKLTWDSPERIDLVFACCRLQKISINLTVQRYFYLSSI